ncbi:hypothetical protein G7K_2169-t2 [Saitoella complicata NRRL Y-17804]|uniref:NF-kappa-B-activating protein C-terminal domain-containing protein n=1 Tax=Saitoella complicata (strain BCRC 22490 / CBS 7301 / JCM 7358 / NBRC 10748 / NRRL Y-17804) TaxID=698492 RepID=A0A0E9NDQ0_SAICN|nr:hypothetical protein G7K_2169-t2 [Saitoella complicata NRRL Y-17804]
MYDDESLNDTKPYGQDGQWRSIRKNDSARVLRTRRAVNVEKVLRTNRDIGRGRISIHPGGIVRRRVIGHPDATVRGPGIDRNATTEIGIGRPRDTDHDEIATVHLHTIDQRSSSRSRVPKPSRDERVNEDNEGDAWVEKSAESRPKPITSKPQPTEADDPSDDEIGPLPPSGGLPTNSPADPPAPTHLSKLEAAGYVLSGSRHKRMAALRAKATSKILTEEDKKKKVQERLEERTRKEEVILEGFRSMVRERQQGENKEESK